MEQEDYKFIRDISIHKRRTRNEKNGTLCMNEGLTVMMLFFVKWNNTNKKNCCIFPISYTPLSRRIVLYLREYAAVLKACHV
ncbi:hypothetical protein [Bacillus sp. T2.9-1]|uniref:hypothetical protein n=1 Tax=Bacillus sp. T2.9-1 TaxID=3041163 RepID=UPI002541C058|nr:hypothetical protein [Bacillus sp. T2.9-1]